MDRQTNILTALDGAVGAHADDLCFIDAQQDYARVSWRQVQVRALRVARAWREQGLARGSYVAVDMANCAALVYAILAAAYGGCRLIALNARLTDAEKAERAAELANADQPTVPVFKEDAILQATRVRQAPRDDEERLFAQECRDAFDEDAPAVVMFTSGTQGKPKAAQLTWGNLADASLASNSALGVTSDACWQLVLPLYHVGGLQILVRSILAHAPFVLYRSFNAMTMLRDARAFGCTHVSVVDKMLQDMLRDEDTCELSARYACILLGGGAPNGVSLQKAVDAGIKVVSSYGMTETCSHIAWVPAADVTGGMHLLPGYRAFVLEPDEAGFGKLAVGGPGVFAGYANAPASFTADGFFITGDRAKIENGRLFVAERTGDMFVSGGENIYPEEIRKKLLQVPSVTEAFVFGAEDEKWGRRPVAFVEMAYVAQEDGFDAQAAARMVAASLKGNLARIYQPREIFVLPELPRRGIGKVNRAALLRRYDSRMAIAKVEMWRIKQPFKKPIRTAKARLRDRESLIVRVTDSSGRCGIGEDVAFATDWYLPETIADDIPVITKTLAPLLLEHEFLHPREVSSLFASSHAAKRHPFACAALETAMWDLYGKTIGRSLVSLIGGRTELPDPATHLALPPGVVPGGAVVGIGSVKDVLAQVEQFAQVGYRRVKLKVKPGSDVKIVQAVRHAFPQMMIMVDANMSYTEDDLDALRALDDCGIACLEEPLDPKRPPAVGPQTLHGRLARLQRDLRCPIALDESWTTVAQLTTILGENPDLRCVVMKIAKFGGIQPALDFCAAARARGISVWMGGMYDTGISKRLHAAFSTLPGVALPGDISDTTAYFGNDICEPPFALTDGTLCVNPPGHETGLGCDVDTRTLNLIAFDRWTLS